MTNDLSEARTIKLEVPKNSDFYEMATSGNQSLLCFVENGLKPAVHYLMLDSKGNPKAAVTRPKVPLLSRGKAFWLQLRVLDQGHFLDSGTFKK